jgi:hypothetical protein
MLPKFNVTGLVYIIRAEESRRVKIGFTEKYPASRMASLQIGSPERLSIVAVVPGSYQLERWVHDSLRSSRAHGEWFGDTEEVRRFVGDVCAAHPLTQGMLAKEPAPRNPKPPKWPSAQRVRRVPLRCPDDVAMAIVFQLGHKVSDDCIALFTGWATDGVTWEDALDVAFPQQTDAAISWHEARAKMDSIAAKRVREKSSWVA